MIDLLLIIFWAATIVGWLGVITFGGLAVTAFTGSDGIKRQETRKDPRMAARLGVLALVNILPIVGVLCTLYALYRFGFGKGVFFKEKE